jgi:hypothetical protein
MSPLNDDELSSLLQQAKSKPPEPPPDLGVRAMRAYQALVTAPAHRWRFWRQPISVRLPIAVAAAVLMVLIGAVAGRSFWRPSPVERTRFVEVPEIQERVVYSACPPAGTNFSEPAVKLSFREFQPVRQIKPRVVRSIRDDQ